MVHPVDSDSNGGKPVPGLPPEACCGTPEKTCQLEISGTFKQLIELETSDFDGAIELGARLYQDLRSQLQEAAGG